MEKFHSVVGGVMNYRKAKQIDKEFVFDLLNWNKFEFEIKKETFEKFWNDNFDKLKIVIYQNLRIGIVLSDKTFLNPLFWEKL